MADRALLIGVNHYLHIPGLRGPVNDVAEVRSVLVGRLGYPETGIQVLTDADVTKPNVLEGLRRIVADVGPKDRAFVHFSGHGSYAADDDGDEPDGYDELFCLHDMAWGHPASYILDDEIRAFIEKLPSVKELWVVLDTCHSGTGLRLVPGPGNGRPSVSIDLVSSLARAGGDSRIDSETAQQYRIVNRFAVPPPEVEARAAKLGQPRPKRRLKSENKAKVLLVAACRADQTAADAFFPEEQKFYGAHSRALCAILRGSPRITPAALRRRLDAAMRRGHFTQEPQVETG